MGNSEPTTTEAGVYRKKLAAARQPYLPATVQPSSDGAVSEPVRALSDGIELRQPVLGTREVQWLWTIREPLAWNGNGATAPGIPAKERVLLVGHGPLADHIVSELQKPNPRYHLVGQLVPVDPGDGLPAEPSRGERRERLEEIISRDAVNRVVIAMSERRGDLPIDQLLACRMRRIAVDEGTAFCERLSARIPLIGLKPGYLAFGDGFQWPSGTAKRALDILLAAIGLLAAAPLFILLPLLIKATSRGPVFYRQARVGLHGRRFLILKFRSMYDGAERSGSAVWAEERDPRITPMGRFMRKFRLDEFPQMLNVLRGEMSFVGPRPERPEFTSTLVREIPYYTLRLAVKPGITGWAQIKYRYGASIQDAAEKLQYDLYYIKHMSLKLDALIAARTIRTVLFQSGAR